MAEEEVAAAADGASPTPVDLKRKLEDSEPQAPEQPDPTSEDQTEPNAELDAAEKEPKRPRLDHKPDGTGILILSVLWFVSLVCFVRVLVLQRIVNGGFFKVF